MVTVPAVVPGTSVEFKVIVAELAQMVCLVCVPAAKLIEALNKDCSSVVVANNRDLAEYLLITHPLPVFSSA